MPSARPPLIAIAGRPNVGKSTLFNRLVGGRPALVHGTPGLTRDRRYGELDYYGHHLRVVDTGGLDPEAAREVVGAGIHRQARAGIEEADAILFVVDGRAGVTPLDDDLADELRKAGKPVLLAVNKIDHAVRESLAAEFYALGLGDLYPISAAHGRGVDELVEAVIEALGTEAAEESEEPAARPGADDGPLRVALVGKPNAGKSSLLNRLLGVERALVHHEPGTTTDPVDTPFEFGGRRYVLIDTAGIRRKARIDADTEKLSVSMALSQLERADVVVLVIDAAAGASEQDARLAGAIEQSGRAVVLALNKADLLGAGDRKPAVARVRDEIHFLPYATVALLSALRGDGVTALMRRIDAAAEQHRRRVPTGELNRFFTEVCEHHPPPTQSGRVVRIHYLTQGGIRPPTFLLFANHPHLVPPSYRRFIGNQLRARYGFDGTPLRVVVKAKRSRTERSGKRRRRR
jgi:GTP-binding protein